MLPDRSRRSLLASGAAASVAALAGCSGGSDDDGTPDPDEGTDSYGILLTSDHDAEQTVRIRVVIAWEDVDPVFDETVTVGPGETREWDGVITERKEQNVVGTIGDGELSSETSNAWITPGSENAPPDANVRVNVSSFQGPDGTEPIISVSFESEAER